MRRNYLVHPQHAHADPVRQTLELRGDEILVVVPTSHGLRGPIRDPCTDLELLLDAEYEDLALGPAHDVLLERSRHQQHRARLVEVHLQRGVPAQGGEVVLQEQFQGRAF